MMKEYFFYVLYTADGYFYGGYSDNVYRRFLTHQAGKGAKFTRVKSRHPLRLIYFESFDNQHDALHAEAMFKKLSRAKKELYLQNQGVDVNIWLK